MIAQNIMVLFHKHQCLNYLVQDIEAQKKKKRVSQKYQYNIYIYLLTSSEHFVFKKVFSKDVCVYRFKKYLTEGSHQEILFVDINFLQLFPISIEIRDHFPLRTARYAIKIKVLQTCKVFKYNVYTKQTEEAFGVYFKQINVWAHIFKC